MKKKKKILHLVTGFGLGGAETALFRLLNSWGDDPDYIHSVVSLRDNLEFNLDGIGVKYKAFDLKMSKFKLPELISLASYMKAEEPDLIHAWMYHACFFSALSLWYKIPVVWGIHHSLHDLGNERPLTRLAILCCSWLARAQFVRSIIYVSNASRVHHERFGYPKIKSIVIPNGFDCAHFAPQEHLRESTRRSLNLPGDAYVIGSFGRFHPVKNHRLLLTGLGCLKRRGLNFYALLAGEGIDGSNNLLISWIQEAGLTHNIVLLGARKDISDLYNVLDLYVLTSNSESFPNVLGEAMATGIPCVATDVGDSRLIVDNSGWIVPVKDAERLAQAITQAYETSIFDRVQLSARSRHSIISRFSLTSIASAYSRLYISLLSQSEPHEK